MTACGVDRVIQAKDSFYILKWLHFKWLFKHLYNIFDFSPLFTKPEMFANELLIGRVCQTLV